MLTKSLRYAHTDPIFMNKDILKLSSIQKFEICKYIHRDFYKKMFFNLTPRSLALYYNAQFNTAISLSHVRTNLGAKIRRSQIVI